MFNLQGKVVVITGANRGIGNTLARGLIQHGAIVYGSTRKSEYRQSMEEAGIHPISLDVQEFSRIQPVLTEIYKKHNKIDCLINNAGISTNIPASLLKSEQVKKIIETNFEAVFYLCQSYYKLQKKYKNKKGNIINIASVLGLVGTMLASVYSGTKGAVIQLTRSLAIEWAGAGFRVNAVCPGFIETDMTEMMQKKEDVKKKVLELIPMRRLGKTEDVLGAVLFLASDYSQYVTGQCIVVDGGLTAM